MVKGLTHTGHQLPHLFGRKREVAVFETALRDARDHADGAALLVTGPPERGRSTGLMLLRELAGNDAIVGASGVRDLGSLREAVAHAAANALAPVLAGRPGLRDALEASRSAVALGASTDAVASYVPGVEPASADIYEGSVELLNRLGLLASTLLGRPLVLLVDDVTDAGPGELSALMNAIVSARHTGALVVVGLAGDPTLARHATPPLTSVVELEVLDVNDTLAMATGLRPDVAFHPDAGEALHGVSHGEPGAIASLCERLPSGPASSDDIERLTRRATATESAPILQTAEHPPPTSSVESLHVPVQQQIDIRGTALRYLKAVARLGEDATEPAIAKVLGDATRFGGGSKFDSVRDELVKSGVLWRSTDGRMVVADRRVLHQLDDD